jgi:hypothetical protein
LELPPLQQYESKWLKLLAKKQGPEKDLSLS